MTSGRIAFLAAVAVFVLCGCEPQQAEEDEIQKTMRMAEEARRQTRSGKGGKSSNVYVSVERIQVATRDAAGLGALWRHTSGRLTVTGGNGLSRGGVRIGLAGENFATQLSACARSARSMHRSTAELTVLSGYSGYMWTGRSVLVPELRIVTSSGEAVVLRRQRLGTALVVRPRILPDGKIELELQPYFAVGGSTASGRKHTVSAMRTRVVVAPGQKLVIGSSTSASGSSVGSGLFGYDSAGKKVATIITVTAARL